MPKIPGKMGRAAHEYERERVNEWVKIYRAAQKSPDGRYCLNPDDEPEAQQFIVASDPEHLLQALESFVEHGTVAFQDTYGFARLIMRGRLKTLTMSGIAPRAAIEKLAEEDHCDPRTIERKLKVNDKL